MIKFIIDSINDRRRTRGAEFIKVKVVEENIDNGFYWYSPKDLIAEIDNYGESNFNNLELVKTILEHEKLHNLDNDSVATD